MPRLLVCVCFFAVCSRAEAQRNLKNIPDPDPKKEMATFKLPKGAKVNLFASDPDIAKPIQMNFGPDGKLWIASSEQYPQLKPGAKPKDKIIVLQDTNGDGKADKRTVFADRMEIPTGIQPGDGGVYVANSTQLIFLKDTNGDGKADLRKVVLSGFGTEDTHHLLHTLRWGPDGRLYMNQSIYIHSHVETPFGVVRLNGGGIWRYSPISKEARKTGLAGHGKLEIHARGFVNPWGHQFDRYGRDFATDGAGGEGINDVVRGAGYPTAVGMRKILHGLNPGSPKHCGLEILDGSAIPESWRGTIVTNDFRGHRVCRFVLSEEGSSFVSRQQDELIKSNHVAFRPIDVQVGPDGAIYIADWYNPIIQHGEVDFRDPRRDHKHGRIWRITFDQHPPVKWKPLSKLPNKELIAKLDSGEPWQRRWARKLLQQRGPKVIKDLSAWQDGLRDDRRLLEALWIRQGVGKPDIDLLKRALRSKNAGIRIGATKILHDWHGSVPRLADVLETLSKDPHLRVRLETLRVLGRIRTPMAVRIALKILADRTDKTLDYAGWLTLSDLQPVWLAALKKGNAGFGEEGMRALLQIGGNTRIASMILAKMTDDDLKKAEPAFLAALAKTSAQRELLRLVRFAGRNADAKQATAIAVALQSVRGRPPRAESFLKDLLQSKSSRTRIAALRLIEKWKVTAMREATAGHAYSLEKRKVPREEWNATYATLGTIAGKDEVILLRQLALIKNDDGFRQAGVILGLARTDLNAAAEAAVKMMNRPLPDAVVSDLVGGLLSLPNARRALQKAVGGKTITRDAARMASRALDTRGIKDEAFKNAFRKAGKLGNLPWKLTAAQKKEMVAYVDKHGDAVRGEAVFRRRGLSCFKCHQIGSGGGRVGPNLISIGSSAQVDYLLDSLIDPNAKIKENFRTIIVRTTGGRNISGVLKRKTDTELILMDAEGRQQNIPLKDIARQRDGRSLMPEDLVDSLTRQEVADLTMFLASLGRKKEFTVPRESYVRTWQVMQATKEAAFRLRRVSYASAATDLPDFKWSSAYSNVRGEFPLDEIPEIRVRNRSRPGARGVGFLRFEFEQKRAGASPLLFNSRNGLQIWIGTQPLPADGKSLRLSPGKHRVTIAVDLATRKKPIRITEP